MACKMQDRKTGLRRCETANEEIQSKKKVSFHTVVKVKKEEVSHTVTGFTFKNMSFTRKMTSTEKENLKINT